MKTFSVVSLLLSARFFALFACIQRAVRVQRAITHSIAAQSSERHANVIAGGRGVFLHSALLFSTRPCERSILSLRPAEVC
jgi:hypothetical protein